MSKNFLAFDLGASSGRGIVGSCENGKITLNEIHRFDSKLIEENGHIYWDFPALIAELKTGLAQSAITYANLDGIGIDTWGVDYVLFDRTTGQIKRNPYHYRDERTNGIPEQVWKLISKDELYKRTGIQFMQLNTLYQLFAHKLQQPEDFENAFMLMMPDALAYVLGAEATTEYTEASTSNLLNPLTRDWDWELIDLLGLPRTIFTPVVASATQSGELNAQTRSELNLPAIPIYKIGSHDTASAVAAVPATGQEKNWAFVSCGTWALLGAEIVDPKLDGTGDFTNEGTVNGQIRYLTNIMGSWLFQETRRNWREAGRQISFADMEDLAVAATPCNFFLNPNAPEFLTPGDMPGRFAEFVKATGQGEYPDDGALLRSVYDSLALYFRLKIAGLEQELKRPMSFWHMIGGGTKDGLLMQLTADASNREVFAGPVEATAIGNIAGQALAAGIFVSLDDARLAIKNSFDVKTYQPRAEMTSLYDQSVEKFLQICQ